MPSYDYECRLCGHKLEVFHSMSAETLVYCPMCNQPELVKLISPGAAVIIKGTKNPCRGNRGGKTKKVVQTEKSKSKAENPFWRDGPIDKDIMKNPEKYIEEG